MKAKAKVARVLVAHVERPADRRDWTQLAQSILDTDPTADAVVLEYDEPRSLTINRALKVVDHSHGPAWRRTESWWRKFSGVKMLRRWKKAQVPI